MVKGKTIIITGAAETFGSALATAYITMEPRHLILIDNAETPLFELETALNPINEKKVKITFILGSIKNKNQLKKIFSEERIDIIFHTAAYKHVSMLESNPFSALEANVFGTINLAEKAIKQEVKDFIYISTDKAVNPISVMGMTKKIAEKYILGLSKSSKHETRFLITRFGNIEYSNGSVIPLFEYQIKNHLPVTITDKKATRYFISISNVVKSIHKSLELGNDGDVLLFNMGKPKNILELAQKIIRDSKRSNIEIKIIGLRQGEKLNEELIEKESILTNTSDYYIFRVQSRDFFDFDNLKTEVQKLKRYSFTTSKNKLKRHLEKLCSSELLN